MFLAFIMILIVLQVDGRCKSPKSSIYKTTVAMLKHTLVLLQNTFKERYYGHDQSLRLKEKEHKPQLSSYLWKLKEKGVEYNKKWSIIEEEGKAYNPITIKCGLSVMLKRKVQHNIPTRGGNLK